MIFLATNLHLVKKKYPNILALKFGHFTTCISYIVSVLLQEVKYH